MTTYIIRELQNAQSSREGDRIEANGLAAAKRRASSSQIFQGTVLVIENEAGQRLAVKEGGRWNDIPA